MNSLLTMVELLEQVEEKSVKRRIGSWLMKHPKINPYKIFKPGIFRVLTTPFRILPDFINIGASKCGTTSLYNYLLQHPNVYSASAKEIHYFDSYYTAYYRSNFPTIFSKYYEKKIRKRPFVTGESTPLYIFYPNIAKKIKKMIPKVKLIVMLRNPIDRAYSQYSEHFNLGYHNSLTFEEVIKKELKLLEKIKNLENEDIKRKNIFQLNIARGIYVDQLQRWMDVFCKDQFLIIKTEEFEKDTQSVMNQVFDFLGIPIHQIKLLNKQNVGKYKPMSNSTRKFLIDYFKSHNERLYQFLQQDFEWDK